MDRRTGLFTVLVVGCAVVAAATVALTLVGQKDHVATGGSNVREAGFARPFVAFRSLSHAKGPAGFGILTLARASDPARTRKLSALQCERVYASPSDGLCVARAGSLVGSYKAKIFGPDLRVRHEVALSGVPSRARVSADGRYGATTTFVAGHSYATPGKFSTATDLIDMRAGKRIANLEQFKVSENGRVIDSPKVNFWGVTFDRANSDHFFATMALGGRSAQAGNQGGTYLIEGHIGARTANVIHENVECPSLSPDGTRIGFKKLVGKPALWRFHVLDLRTGRETALAEVHPVDDQLEWLDNDTLLYASNESIWAVPADGSGAPRQYLAQADSPAVVR